MMVSESVMLAPDFLVCVMALPIPELVLYIYF